MKDQNRNFSIQVFKDKSHVQQQYIFNITWKGKSDVAPSTIPVVLQIYNRNTPSWEEIARNNTSPANTDFTLTATIGESGQDLANYYDANYWIACRVYQDGT